jgi:hypothetical protein
MKEKMFCPPIKTSLLKTKKAKILVVRDDFLEGGTKQRAAIPFLNKLKEEGIEEFVYASPFSGFAQIALSISFKEAKVASIIFSSLDDNGNVSSYTKIASKNSKIISCQDLQEAEKLSDYYQKNKQNCLKIPLGFNHPLFIDFLKKELKEQLKLIGNFNRLWIPVGSGTLAKTFRDILPDKRLVCVNIRVIEDSDYRIRHIHQMENSSCYKAHEEFKTACELIPPIPSNLFYDSKLWRFINEFAENGDVWWNVAK